MEEGVVWGIGNKVVIFVVVGEVVIRWIVFDRVNVVVIFGLSLVLVFGMIENVKVFIIIYMFYIY